jgi:hypothetical protein
MIMKKAFFMMYSYLLTFRRRINYLVSVFKIKSLVINMKITNYKHQNTNKSQGSNTQFHFLNIEQGTPILDFRNNHVLIETSKFIIR